MALAAERRSQLDGIVQKMDSEGASTPEIQSIVDDFKSKYDQPAPSQSAPARQPDAFEQAVNYRTGNNYIDAPMGVVQGAAKGAAEIGTTIGAATRYLTGRPQESAEEKDADTKPSGIGQGTGKFLEQAAEYAAPAGYVGRATKTAGLLARSLAQAGTGAVVSAAQTQGNPNAIALGAGLGAAGEVAGAGIKALRGASPTALDPAEQQAVQFAKENGIPLDAATRTGNPVIRNLQGIVQNSPIGGGYAKKAMLAQKDAIGRVGEDLASQVSKASTNPETAGQAVRDALSKRTTDLSSKADEAYGKLRTIEADPANAQTVTVGTKTETSNILDAQGKPVTTTTPIQKSVPIPTNLGDAQAQLKPVLEEWEKLMPIAQQRASKGLLAIKNVLEADSVMSASQAEQNLSALKAAQREAPNPQSARLLGQAVGKMQAAVDKAVSAAGPDAMTALQDGRALTRAKYATQDTLDNLRTEPVQLFNQLTHAKDSGINLLRDVANKTPEALPALGRAYLEGLLDRVSGEAGMNTAQTALREYQKLGTSTKDLLFNLQKPGAELSGKIENFLTLAKKAAENPNPSGSGFVAQLTADGALMVASPHIGVPYLIAKGALARILFSPGGAEALSMGLKVPRNANGGSALAVQRILAVAGKSAKPIAQTESATAFQSQ